MYSIGYDIGSSSIKGALVNLNTGESIQAQYPDQEMTINSPQSNWAEQHPQTWWTAVHKVTEKLLTNFKHNDQIQYIGIAYQMHGLVAVDNHHQVIRPAIIWCDSRAIKTGKKITQQMGKPFCQENYLNTPGNFTLSKLKWIKDNEPKNFEKIHKIMLPGDYIAWKLTGDMTTTIPGLSEGIMWNFKTHRLASEMLSKLDIPQNIFPPIVKTFTNQNRISKEFSEQYGLPENVSVCYRAGDQPNNAFSLNVLNPGEVATTAGTSGVVYGISKQLTHDTKSRVNTFAHVNHKQRDPRLGILLCINGCGISNAWIKKLTSQYNYDEMNKMAANIPIGSAGIHIYPFGNGAERMLENRTPGASIINLDYNQHTPVHLFRATQEAVAFSFSYGMKIMKEMGINLKIMRAGATNMFQSPVFRETLANINNSVIELYNTDGSIGAARGAGIGGGYYTSAKEAFSNLEQSQTIEPDPSNQQQYLEVFEKWKCRLNILSRLKLNNS